MSRKNKSFTTTKDGLEWEKIGGKNRSLEAITIFLTLKTCGYLCVAALFASSRAKVIFFYSVNIYYVPITCKTLCFPKFREVEFGANGTSKYKYPVSC